MAMATLEKPKWQDVARTAQEYRDASITRVEPAVPHVPVELPRDVTAIPGELLDKAELDITQAFTRFRRIDQHCGDKGLSQESGSSSETGKFGFSDICWT